MNRYEPSLATAREARLRYGDGDYQIVEPGDFVRCAVTAEPIPVDRLKYWSVARQEPYISAAAGLERRRGG
jgi:hypothetical protein